MLSKKIVITSSALLAALQNVQAESQQFGLVSIRSGSSLQYSSALIDITDSTDGYYPINIGSAYGNPTWEYVVDDQGHLVANGSYYWAIIPNTNGQYGATTDVSKAIKGFSIQDGNLASAQNYAFEAVPNNSAWDLYSQDAAGPNGNSDNNLDIALACYTTTGFASDFVPSESSNDSVSGSNSTSTVASNTTTTLAPSSAVVDNSTVPIASTSAAPAKASSSVAASSVASSSAAATSAVVASSNTTATNSTSSNSTSTQTHKNGAAGVAKGSISLLAMGLAGLFL